VWPLPSVFGRNLQCEPVSKKKNVYIKLAEAVSMRCEENLRGRSEYPVRKVTTREECYWSHAWKSFKRAGVGTHGTLECKDLSENTHRTRKCAVAETSSEAFDAVPCTCSV
jgi:hypothetical protein